MKLRLVFTLAVALAAAALSSPASEAATPPTIGGCFIARADATLSLGAGVPAVQATAPGGYGSSTYGNQDRPCSSFVVDINVPYDSSAPGFRPAFSITASGYLPTELCETYSEWTSVYRRNPGASTFTYLGHLERTGSTLGGPCVLRLSDDSRPWPASFAPPRRGVATYRVITGAAARVAFGWGFFERTVRAAHLPSF